MKLNDLKLVALFYINEDEVLSDRDKFKLMEFVEKSEQKDILLLLATGQMPGNEILTIEESEGAFRISEFIYMSHPLSGVLATNLARMGYHGYKTWKSIKDPWKEHEKTGHELGTATTAVSSFAAAAAFKIKQQHIEKLSKMCDKEKGMAKKVCHNKIRRDGMRHEITVLSGLKNICNKSREPNSCKKKIDTRIKVIQKKMDSIKVF